MPGSVRSASDTVSSWRASTSSRAMTVDAAGVSDSGRGTCAAETTTASAMGATWSVIVSSLPASSGRRTIAASEMRPVAFAITR